MKEYKSELLAISKAGHDKGTVYVVLEADETYFWLTDGKRRLLENPKKKKQIHVQVIKYLSEELLEQMQSITLDAHVRKILKKYQNSDTEES
jgi:hypothetical protein